MAEWNVKTRPSRSLCPAIICAIFISVHLPFIALAGSDAPASLGPLAAQTVDPSKCLLPKISQIATRCGSKPSPGGPSLRESLIKAVKDCLYVSLGMDGRQTVIRVLAPASKASYLLANSSNVLASLANLVVTLDLHSTAIQLSMSQPAVTNTTHEAWIFTPSLLGMGVAHGAFMDLSELVFRERRLQWEGLLPAVRGLGLVYRSQILALPLSTHSLHLYYDKGVFSAQGWELPRTWWDLVYLAERINGTNGKFALCGAWCGVLNVALLRYILASYHQTLGSTHGWLIDPESLEVLLGSPAMIESIQIIRALQKLSPPGLALKAGCVTPRLTFETGQCLLGLAYPATFKQVAIKRKAGRNSSLRGRLGVAQLPGADRVLDRSTNTLVACDEIRCPYANKFVHPNGSLYWVNTSPGFDAHVMAINGHSKPDDTFSLIAFLASPVVLDQLIYHPEAEVFPSRGSQLDPASWVKAGYHHKDASQFCSAHAASLSHPNLHAPVRSAAATQLLEVLLNTAEAALLGSAPAQSLAADALLQAQAVLNGNLTEFQLDYASSLNWVRRSQEIDVEPTLVNDHDENAFHQLSLVIGLVIGPCALMLFLVGCIIRGSCLSCLAVSAKQTAQDRPGAGPDTTLLITDVENSTNLWEELEAGVMDVTMKLHDACLRQLAVEHHGVETGWEGDSFLIAFYTPVSALNFALEAQIRLLVQPWPAALLAVPFAAPVWMRPGHHSTGKLGLKSLLGSSGKFASQMKEQSLAAPAPGEQKLYYRRHSSAVSSTGSDSVHTGTLSGQSYPKSIGLLSALPRAPSLYHLMDPALPSLEVGPATLYPQDQLTASLSTAADEEASPDTLQAAPSCEVATLGQEQQKLWTLCTPGTPGACCAFAGLRVRIGLHAGIHSSDITFSDINNRWRYSGLARVVTGAVVAAGHGGQVLFCGGTARLFKSNPETEQLHLLPPDCSVFHMGRHKLADVSESQDLLCVLPNSLLCRMAIQQDPLRDTHCLMPGVLAAPAPVAIKAGLHGPFLACVQLLELDALWAWDKLQTVAALRTAHDFVLEHLQGYGGQISEDGWGFALLDACGGTKLDDSRRKATNRSKLVCVFSNASNALLFALQLYSKLPHLHWSEHLLSNAICTPQVKTEVGSSYHGSGLGDWKEPAGPFHHSRRSAGAEMMGQSSHWHPPSPELQPRAPSASSLYYYHYPSNLPSTEENVMTSATLKIEELNGGLCYTVNEDGRADLVSKPSSGFEDQLPSAPETPTSLRLAPEDVPWSAPLRLGDRLAQVQGDAGVSVEFASQQLPVLCFTEAAGLPADIRASAPVLNSANVGRRTRVRQRSSLLQFASKRSLESARTGQESQRHASVTNSSVRILHPQLLRGLRFKAAVTCGIVAVEIATRSTGRAVYSGPAEQSLRKLLKQAGQGQVATTLVLLQEGLQV